MRNSVFAVAVAGVLAAAPANAVNLVTNGGFETGNFAGWSQVNDTSFTGVDCTGTFGVVPLGGTCQAFFGPLDPGGGGILQTLTTVAGGKYNVSFQLANLGGPPNAFGLFWDGGFYSIDFDLSEFPYQTIGVTLTASGTATDLGFIFYHEQAYFLLDDVVAEAAVPEPAAWALMIAGFAMAGTAMRRRTVAVAA